MAGERARLWPPAIGRALASQARAEWWATPFHNAALGLPKADSLKASPRNPRPLDLARGQALLQGTFVLAGESLALGPGGDPWNRVSPSLAFAERLHSFDWIGDLAALTAAEAGAVGAREALRLTLDWKRLFGRWTGFAWGAHVLERRVFNLACVAETLVAGASDWETGQIADSLARQARHLLGLGDEPPHAAERLIACALAGIALNGAAGDGLTDKALPRLDAALAQAVLPDGGHATRSPEAGLGLLLDLLALDDGLTKIGRTAGERIARTIDRLSSAVRFFTLADGRLAAFQGGEPAAPGRITAAKAAQPKDAPFSGYQRLTGAGMDVMLDAGPPATGAWSLAACGQVGAIEVVCGRDRLIGNCGWSPRAHGADRWRLDIGGSGASLEEAPAGAPLSGYLARALGPRLVGAPEAVVHHRRENDTGVWVEVSHDGWLAATGLTHERRLYLDKALSELRGEDRFIPSESAHARPVTVAIRFHLPPEVHALVSRDRRSVLLRGASNVGWWLRSDASEVVIDPSVSFRDGVPLPASQIVLRGRLRADRGGRVRWKLAAAEPPSTV